VQLFLLNRNFKTGVDRVPVRRGRFFIFFGFFVVPVRRGRFFIFLDFRCFGVRTIKSTAPPTMPKKRKADVDGGSGSGKQPKPDVVVCQPCMSVVDFVSFGTTNQCLWNKQAFSIHGAASDDSTIV